MLYVMYPIVVVRAMMEKTVPTTVLRALLDAKTIHLETIVAKLGL